STKMLIVNVSVTSEMLQPNCFESGTRKTLHAYTAPKAICKNTPAIAITHRLLVRINSSYHRGITTPPFLGIAAKVVLSMFSGARPASGGVGASHSENERS